ncbi:MAG: 4Fe-4S binding protein, partial [Bacteroidales bacterium]|nr:4Fe-4S binding protein [Bacteroidales bacterium]
MNGSRLDKLRRIMQYGFLAAVAAVVIYPNLLPGMHRVTILFLWLIVVANLFFGKLFCSHLCPGGLLSEYAAKLKNKFFGTKWGIKRWSLPDNLLSSLKYILAIVL